jgi:hypothetical protein
MKLLFIIAVLALGVAVRLRDADSDRRGSLPPLPREISGGGAGAQCWTAKAAAPSA